MDSVYLHGSEQVQTAANTMRHAAEEMNQAARNLDGTLERHKQWMDDWLYRFEQALERKP